MSRRVAPLQINKFIGGLNTESSPLEVPPDTTSSELNMEMGADGSRYRRLAFNYEDGYSLVDTGVVYQPSREAARNLYKWGNAGGDPSKFLYVVQIGNYLGIFDPDKEASISLGDIYSEELGDSSYDTLVDFTVIDGLLIAATGQKLISAYEYVPGSDSVTKTEVTLRIRDLFGVETTVDGTVLTDSVNLNVRPFNINDSHTYNLRNQTFGTPKRVQTVETTQDPIYSFVTTSSNTSGVFPSNADNLNRYFYPDAEDADNRLVERFFAANMFTDPPGISEAPKGYFVIDALERGTSRLARIDELESSHTFSYTVTQLPLDKTPGGASVVGQFAGRVWYGGFSGEVSGGDSKSPRMSSYLLFSSLVREKSALGECYQKADPTSNIDPDLADDDGGFLRVDGAYGINKLLAVDNSLFVFAENGVWRISGSDESAFTAASYQVKKLTDEGCVSAGSVVQIGKTLFYWGSDAIFYVAQDRFGNWAVESITQQKIQQFYSQITSVEKTWCSGHFDSLERKIRWVYTGTPGTATESKELVLNVDYSAFTVNTTPTRTSNLPLVVAVEETNPYNLSSATVAVTADGVVVTANGEEVSASVTQRVSVVKEVIYLSISGVSPTLSFTFGVYDSTGFYDWSDSGEGVTYPAYLVSGALTGGEARYKKQVPYLNTFFKVTEAGFDNDLNPLNQSSCLLSSQWNWTSGNSSGKWSTPRQAYRRSRLYFPEDSSDSYESGDTVVSTRNKIRGIGHSVSFKFEAEPGKNLHIYGWSFDIQANARE